MPTAYWVREAEKCFLLGIQSVSIRPINRMKVIIMVNGPNLKLWAKTGRDGDLHYHPLLYHMLDVAAVATYLWELLSEDQRRRIGHIIGSEARTITLFLAGGHDIGKACPGFQQQAPQLSKLIELPMSLNSCHRPHAFVSACILNRFFTNLLGQIAGGHHGIFPQPLDLRMGCDTLGNIEWETARDGLLQELATALKIDINDDTECKPQIIDPFIVPMLAGLISIADWIGSNQDFFPCLTEPGQQFDIIADKYFESAKDRAGKALRELGWMNNGFEIIDVIALDEGFVKDKLTDTDNTGHNTNMFSVRFDGLLKVTDVDVFYSTLRSGIGSAKGFGFGLLSIAPIKE